MTFDDVQLPRQQVIRGAGLVLTAGALAACATSEEKPAAGSEAIDVGRPGISAPPHRHRPPPRPAVRSPRPSDVPVGSGVIVDDVVVTQPAAGEFKGFSAKCTHKGCAVNKVADGTIDCPCHGSKFNLDGTVANGPATDLWRQSHSVRGRFDRAGLTRSG